MPINKFQRFLISHFHPSRSIRRYYRFYSDDVTYCDKMINGYTSYIKNLLSLEQTLDLMIDKKLSVARFGDGEFACICTRKGIRFQKSSHKLKKRLIDVANSKNEKLLICMPSIATQNQQEWSLIIVRFWSQLKKYLKYNHNRLLGDSLISRTPAFELGLKQKWLAIFNQRKIVFVTGKNSRFDSNHELFAQAHIIGMVDAPATHAFDDYDHILQQCLTYDKDILFLIALGPTATILAHDLCLNGYHAIDIGHITSCHDVFYYDKEEPEKMPVENK